MLAKVGIGLLFLSLAACVHASEENKFKLFFSEYETLNKQFDVAVAKLYSDEAKVIGVRSMPDGTEKTLSFDGKKWKQLIVDLMGVAKERGDTSKFTDINITEEGNTAKIRATRYSLIKCHEDKDYYMVVNTHEDGRIEIIEEFSKSPQLSKCKNAPKDDLAVILQATVIMVSKQLPIMLDSDTRLEKISSEGNVLKYQFELVNYASTDLDPAALTAELKLSLIQQACTTTNLRSILEQGGMISYRYYGKDKLQVAEIKAQKDSCSKP